MMVRHAFTAMGSPCVLHAHTASPDAAATAFRRAEAEVRRLEARYSRYRDDSELSRINRSAGAADGIEVDPETAALLDYADTAWRQSSEMFDITSGVLRRVWNFKVPVVPAAEKIDEALRLVGWGRVGWKRPYLTLPAGMELDLGGMVKEYAADCACRELRRLGVQDGLVDLGGDLAIVGPHLDGTPWQVGIRNPQRPDKAVATIALHSGAMASSGNYERCFDLDGRRYSHILNPKTGWPAAGLAGASVAAPVCLIAGTAATSAMLMGPELGAAWIAELGLSYLCIDDSGELSGTLCES